MHEYLRALEPDVVHAHDVYGLMVQGLRVPRVFTIHGFIYGDTLVSGERLARVRAHIWKRIELSGWADQPHIISISPYVRERLAGVATGVIHDIDNPISESSFTVCPVASARPMIFSAAVISPRKNTLTLVDAFARLRRLGVDAELRLAGDVVDARYGEIVHARAQHLRVADRISFLGRISSREVSEQLAQSTVFALVSLEENSPMGIEEAMAAGVPVVTSNRCGMPYMVRDGESGYLVDPHDPADIAERLTAVIDDPATRQRMSECSRSIARDRFHPDAVARRTRHVYERACGRMRSYPSGARDTVAALT
jgi:glycosyltransferase involved in cell wall biosynthesis